MFVYMNNEKLFSTLEPHDLLVLPGKINGLEIPDWNIARHLVFPYLEPAAGIDNTSVFPGCRADVSAQNSFEPLSGMITGSIKMSLAIFYQGRVIPLSESLIREWSISVAAVRLAMDINISLVARSVRLVPHKKGSFVYHSLHSDAAPFNSALPFYTPFQETAAALLGSPFYFAVPERRTVILFGADMLPLYRNELRDDIFLTYETSTSSLSTELIEVSESGTLPFCR